MNRYVTVRIVVFVALFTSVLPTQRAFGQSLPEIYDLARAKDPAIGQANARLAAERQNHAIATAGLYPRVDATAGVNHTEYQVNNYRPSTLEGGFDGHNYGLNVVQPVLRGPAWAALESASAAIRGAEAAALAVQQELMFKTAEAYFDFLKSRKNVRIAMSEKGRIEQVLEQAKAFLAAGTGDIIAVHEAKARVDTAQAQLVIAQSEQNAAAAKLQILVGMPVRIEHDIAPTAVEGGDALASFDQWLQTMLSKHPVITRGRESIALREAELKAAAREHWPIVDFNTSYSVNRGDIYTNDLEKNELVTGVNMRLPIYRGGETRSREEKAKALVEEGRFALKEAIEQLNLKLVLVFTKLQSNASIIAAYDQQRQSAETQLNAVRKGKSIGTRSAIDLLDAEQIYAASERNFYLARYDHLLLTLSLKAAAGVLAEADIVRVAGMLIPVE